MLCINGSHGRPNLKQHYVRPRPRPCLECKHTIIFTVVRGRLLPSCFLPALNLVIIMVEYFSHFQNRQSHIDKVSRPKKTSQNQNESIVPWSKETFTPGFGYMVFGYMVFSAIWSIFGWSRFSNTKIFRIYGQISDIWSILWGIQALKLMKSMPISDC